MTLQYKHNIRIVSGNIFVLASKQESKVHQSLAFHHVSKTGTNRFYIYQQRMYKHAYYIYIYTYYIPVIFWYACFFLWHETRLQFSVWLGTFITDQCL